jgi:hypothetical protein
MELSVGFCDADAANPYLHEFFWIQILWVWPILEFYFVGKMTLRIRIRMDPHR